MIFLLWIYILSTWSKLLLNYDIAWQIFNPSAIPVHITFCSLKSWHLSQWQELIVEENSCLIEICNILCLGKTKLQFILTLWQYFQKSLYSYLKKLYSIIKMGFTLLLFLKHYNLLTNPSTVWMTSWTCIRTVFLLCRRTRATHTWAKCGYRTKIANCQ